MGDNSDSTPVPMPLALPCSAAADSTLLHAFAIDCRFMSARRDAAFHIAPRKGCDGGKPDTVGLCWNNDSDGVPVDSESLAASEDASRDLWDMEVAVVGVDVLMVRPMLVDTARGSGSVMPDDDGGESAGVAVTDDADDMDADDGTFVTAPADVVEDGPAVPAVGGDVGGFAPGMASDGTTAGVD